MSDEELTAFLRGLPFLRAAKAADRIEALEREKREAALDALAAAGQAQEAYEAQLKAEAKLAKAVEGLLLARVHVANNEQGWSVGRASARSDLEIINATLAEIESSPPYGLEGEKG